MDGGDDAGCPRGTAVMAPVEHRKTRKKERKEGSNGGGATAAAAARKGDG